MAESAERYKNYSAAVCEKRLLPPDSNKDNGGRNMPLEQLETEYMPVLALRGLVLFPHVLLHFDVGRKKSVNALNLAMSGDQRIFLTAQRDIVDDEPAAEDLYRVGCIAKVRQILRSSGDVVRVVVEGESRAVALSIDESADCFMGEIQPKASKKARVGADYKTALVRHIRTLFGEYAAVCPKLPPDVGMSVLGNDDPDFLSDYIASNIPISLEYKQEMLEQFNPVKRLELLATMLLSECEFLRLENEIGEKVREQIDENQRDYFLREQLKVISEELGDDESPEQESDAYRNKIEKLAAPDEVKTKLFKEVDKLLKMPSGSHEATVVRGYLDTCLALPWGVYTTDKFDLEKAGKLLDRDHYGMEKVKERILELLAVYRLNPDIKGQIICLAGPPGVGKTSIAKSIANCMGRKYYRVSLGGVHDEAEIRGHRKTYIGAMPGRIISAISHAGSSNPLILLDEIDKLGNDYKGDPASALLEALDSEQNSTFRDHFIDMPYDLSKVLFLTTANDLSTVPAPLLDRMEVIELSSYTREDKFRIAKGYLVKKQFAKHGLSAKTCKLDNSAIYALIDSYTRESGVRKLERSIGTLCRKAAVKLISENAGKVVFKAADLEELLGPAKYKNEMLLPKDEVGTVNGLAWTSVGGELMQLEVAALDGKGGIEMTGSLGDVMKESAKTAVSYVRSIAADIGVPRDFNRRKDIHIHATEAAVPKDGPSAGVTMVTALVSALTGIPVKRDVAMTGEISLRGRVLPIGGLKEKSMAAYRAGIRTVFIPADNLPDLREVDSAVKAAITFVPVENVWSVITGALSEEPGRQPAPRQENIAIPAKAVKTEKSRGGRQNELQ